MFITGAGHADWFFVLGYTDKSAGYKGMSAFIVESGFDGVSLGKKESNMGQRASDTRGVRFDEVHVPVENLVGGVEGKGWFNAMKAFDLSRPNVAAQAVGCARAAYEHALQYADERKTFGKKLHEHQAIQFMLADMKTKIEASRLLTWRTAWEADNGILRVRLTRSDSPPIHAWKSPPMQYRFLVATATQKSTRWHDSCAQQRFCRSTKEAARCNL